MKSGVFIERDGVLTHSRVEQQHQISPLTVKEFRPRLEILPLLNELKAAGLILIVTTNQPGLSRGSLSRRELDRMHDLLKATFPVDDIFVCPHDNMDDCPCHKPKPGLIVEACYKWRLSPSHSFVISDKWQDAEAARAVGCSSLLLKSPWLGNGHRDYVLPDLGAVVEKILELVAPGCSVAA